MNRIDRYILWEWLRAFTLSIGATLGLLVIYDMYDNLGDLLDFKASVRQVLFYYFMVIPTLLPLVLPIAFLVSLLFSLSRLHGNNEVVAMRSCGMSFWQITRSLWLIGLSLSIGLLYLNAKVVPWAVEEARLIWDDLELQYLLQSEELQEVGLLYNVAFDNPTDRRIWFMNRFSKNSFRGYGVTVSTMDGENREHAKIQASESYFDTDDRFWTFYRGRELKFDVDTGDLIQSKPFDQLKRTDYNESPRLMMTLDKRPKDLSLSELRAIMDYFATHDTGKVTSYRVRYHSILAGTAICFIIVGIAVPYSVSGVRVNAMVGVCKSAGLFFSYYLIARLAVLMGEQGYLPAVYAAWLPNIFMAFLAGYLYRKL